MRHLEHLLKDWCGGVAFKQLVITGISEKRYSKRSVYFCQRMELRPVCEYRVKHQSHLVLSDLQ